MRRQKKGNYSSEDRRLILEAATSNLAGNSIQEKQQWLLKMGVLRPGVPNEPVSESAIKYWQNAHKKVKNIANEHYENAMNKLLDSPPSYRALRDQLPFIISGSIEE